MNTSIHPLLHQLALSGITIIVFAVVLATEIVRTI
jgi:hypothetical protein